MPLPNRRREAIRDLLLQDDIRSQAELKQRLELQGFPTSQPMISRDLRALRVAKQEGAYHVVDEERVTPLTALRSLLRSAVPVASLVLVRCEPGAASAVARSSSFSAPTISSNRPNCRASSASIILPEKLSSAARW